VTSKPNSLFAVAQASYVPPSPYLCRIRDVVYQEAGIFFPDNKLRFLEDRCTRRMEQIAVANVREYCEFLTRRPERRAELLNLLNEITVGETCFFRNQSQLDALRRIVLPKIVEARANISARHLRIWSAGCSTGEEPYSLAMMLLEEQAGVLKNYTFEIQATDINENSLFQARQGVYGDYSLRNVKEYYRQKYFVPADNSLKVSSQLESVVTFSRLNLLDQSRMVFMRGMDAIVCCNVLIYFDADAKRKAVQNFYDNLLPHGYLLLGHAESLYGISEQFRLIHLPSATAYVKADRPKEASKP
jgi:chemotaxis protein methyltransferase CheR